jgi:hypothetical protein
LLDCQTTSGIDPLATRRIDPSLRSVDLDGEAAPAERAVHGVHRGDPRRERAPSIARRATAWGVPVGPRGRAAVPCYRLTGSIHAQSRPKPRGGSMLANSSRSRSTIACNAAPVALSRNASGSTSSQAAYSDCNATSVATAACHCCGRLRRRLGCGGRGGAAARLLAWRWR